MASLSGYTFVVEFRIGTKGKSEADAKREIARAINALGMQYQVARVKIKKG